MRKTFLVMLVTGFLAFCLIPSAYSQEDKQDFKYSISGIFYEQPSYFNIRNDNLLNPDNKIIDFSEWTNTLYSRINFNLSYKKLKFTSQFRPTVFLREGKTTPDIYTDDAYLDFEIDKGYFIYAGKRNIRDGVAYGANPTDFLGENKLVDYTKREEERRVERKGNYLFGGDVYMKNLSFTAMYAPKIDDVQEEKGRLLLRGNVFLESINTDMGLHLFYGKIPGVGINVSTSVGDNLILYSESAFRWGSNKRHISVLNPGNSSAPRTYEITDPSDSNKVYPNIVVGGSYTFGDGTNLIVEYNYHGQGYSSSEWKDFTDFLKYNNESYRNNFFKDMAKGNLAQGNGIMNFREMRKNYVFLRVSNSKLIDNVDGQVAFLLNADDTSFLINPTVDYKISKNLVAGVSSTFFGGKKDSEFGMMGWNTEVTFVIKYYF